MKEDEARALLAQYREARRIGDPAAIAKARLDFRALAVPPEVSTEIERREIDEKLAAAIDALPADASRGPSSPQRMSSARRTGRS